jgi:4-alpha-glucanotransferase
MHWLKDYALFRALKARYGGAYYLEWPTELVQRTLAALTTAQRELASQIEQVRFAQFLLFRQGERLKEHAHSKGVRLIGDLPFFVSPDSRDLWANPELFLLDEGHRPRFVAGVPPSVQGQLWGNPVYDWEALRRTGYRWCIDRFRALLAHVDMIRLDHFVRLQPPGTYHSEQRRPKLAIGQRARAPSSSAWCREVWVVCRSSPRIWG